MSALAEALVAAQRRAVSVLEKAYVAGACDLEPCPACAERDAAEWEPDPRAEPLDLDFRALFYGDEPA